MAELDLVVIGAGPGGYVAAIRAAQLGLRTAVVEQERAGGVCGNWGCIPSKAILADAELYRELRHAESRGIVADGLRVDFARVLARSRAAAARQAQGVESLFRKHHIELVQGRGRPVARRRRGAARRREAGASGRASRPPRHREPGAAAARAAGRPGRGADQPRGARGSAAAGIAGRDRRRGGGRRVRLRLRELRQPRHRRGDGRRAAAGNGRGPGARARAVVPPAGHRGARRASLRAAGARGRGGARDGRRRVRARGRSPRSACSSPSDALRSPTVSRWTRSACGWTVASSPSTARCGRARGTVSAIGDLVGPLLLAHAASEQGVVAVEAIAGHRNGTPAPDPTRVPMCVYCQPEVAAIGLTEAEARARGPIKVGKVPFRASARRWRPATPRAW